MESVRGLCTAAANPRCPSRSYLTSARTQGICAIDASTADSRTARDFPTAIMADILNRHVRLTEYPKPPYRFRPGGAVGGTACLTVSVTLLSR